MKGMEKNTLKIKKILYTFVICIVIALSGCNSKKDADTNESNQTVASDSLADETNGFAESTNGANNEITIDVDKDDEADIALNNTDLENMTELTDNNLNEEEEDLTGLVYVELKPIIDTLDDVWGKNWLEWNKEDFIEKFNLVEVDYSPGHYWEGEGEIWMGSMHMDSEPEQNITEDDYIMSEHGNRPEKEGILAVKYLWKKGNRMEYTRVIRFTGEMNEDPFTDYFNRCQGCEKNDCSKCKVPYCEGCKINECKDCKIEDCQDCLIKNGLELLKFWGVDDSMTIATDYGKADLKILYRDDEKEEIEFIITGFKDYEDLEVHFASYNDSNPLRQFQAIISADIVKD